MAEIGLATGEDDVVMVMGEGKPICVAEISRKLGIRHSTTQRLLDQLVLHGHIERAENPLFRLSKKGVDALAQIEALRVRMAADIEAMLGTIALSELAGHLEKIEAGFGEALNKTV